jgi:hypothetical protein
MMKLTWPASGEHHTQHVPGLARIWEYVYRLVRIGKEATGGLVDQLSWQFSKETDRPSRKKQFTQEKRKTAPTGRPPADTLHDSPHVPMGTIVECSYAICWHIS